MLLKSEIDSGVVGRSTYFTHHYRVDDENSQRHNHSEGDVINVVDDFGNVGTLKISDDTFEGLRCQCTKYLGNNNRLRSLRRAKYLCLNICVSHFSVTKPCYS